MAPQCLTGGAGRVLPGASVVLAELRTALAPDVLLGAGTITTAREAHDAVQHGASFLVSPHLSEEALHEARGLGVPYVPGVITPTEIVRARTLGADVLKVFPIGSFGGPAYLRDLLGPFPDLRVMVTGGIPVSDVTTYLNSGALAVGLGSNLFPRHAVEAHDRSCVEESTRDVLGETGRSAGVNA